MLHPAAKRYCRALCSQTCSLGSKLCADACLSRSSRRGGPLWKTDMRRFCTLSRTQHKPRGMLTSRLSRGFSVPFFRRQSSREAAERPLLAGYAGAHWLYGVDLAFDRCSFGFGFEVPKYYQGHSGRFSSHRSIRANSAQDVKGIAFLIFRVPPFLTSCGQMSCCSWLSADIRAGELDRRSR